MPRVQQFDAGNLALQPTEIGVESEAAAGRRLGAFYNQVGQARERFGERAGQELGSAIKDIGEAYVTGETNREVRFGADTYAKILANKTNEWNEIAKNADPNDASIAQKFLEENLEPTLNQFRDGFHTEAAQNWAEHHVEELRNHFVQKTTSDMATLAGQAARVNAVQTVNTLSNTAYNDPSTLKFALSSVDSSIGGIVHSSPNLKGTTAAALHSELSEKAREQIVKSAAIGAIEKTGQVPGWVSDPQYSKYVNGIELKQFQKAVEAQQRANLFYQKQTENLQKQQADTKAHQDADALIANSVTVDPTNPNKLQIAPDAMNKALDIARRNPNSPAAAGIAKTMIDWLQAQHRERAEPVVSAPEVKSDLLTRMTDPNRPTTKLDIMKAEATDKLSTRDGTILKGMVDEMGPELSKDPIIKAAIDAARERVGVNLMENGHERYSNFLQFFLPEYLKEKRDGTLPSNALDLNDEKSLIRQSLKQWEPSQAERLRAHVMKNLQSVTPNAEAPASAAPSAPQSGGPRFIAPAGWLFSPSRQQYRDPASGKVYDLAGREVK